MVGIVRRFIDALKGENFNADVFPEFLEAFITLFKCNMSGDILRSLALFITYALHDGRTFSYRNRARRSATRIANGDVTRTIDSERSTPRSLSPSQPEAGVNDLSRQEIGVQILEAYSDILCDPNSDDPIKRFAKTVTNKVCEISSTFIGPLIDISSGYFSCWKSLIQRWFSSLPKSLLGSLSLMVRPM